MPASGLRSRGSLGDVASWRSLIRPLSDGTDILQSHKIGSNVWASVLGTLARTPVIVAHEHTWSFQGKPLRKLLDRHPIAAQADAFLAVSELDRRPMIEIERIDPAKVIFVPNGMPDPPPPGATEIRRELGIDGATPIVGTVCALRSQKALDAPIDAAATFGPGRGRTELERRRRHPEPDSRRRAGVAG
jgi:hypothetical protein